MANMQVDMLSLLDTIPLPLVFLVLNIFKQYLL